LLFCFFFYPYPDESPHGVAVECLLEVVTGSSMVGAATACGADFKKAADDE
jgi:hypothetical protein